MALSHDIPEDGLDDSYRTIGQLSQIRSSLEGAALKTLLEKRDTLTQSKHFPFDTDQQLDVAQLATIVGSHFGILRSRDAAGEPWEKIQESNEYKDIVYWLSLSGVVVPNIAGDWEVDRTRKAEDNLGIKSFEALELTLIKRYSLVDDPDPVFRHLEKGPGNGEAMKIRKTQNDLRPAGEKFEQFGIADKLYYPVEKVLEHFIKPEAKEDPLTRKFVELLGFALRQELKRRWYEAEGNVIKKWVPKVDFFDLNLIYELLREPGPWLSQWYNPETGKFKISQEFENDREVKFADVSLEDHIKLVPGVTMSGNFGPKLHRIFLELQGYAPSKIEETAVEAELKDLREKRQKIEEKAKVLKDFMRVVKAMPSADVLHHLPQLIQQLRVVVETDPSLPDRTLEYFLLYLDETYAMYTEAFSLISEREKAVTDRAAQTQLRIPMHSVLERIFTDSFAEGVMEQTAEKPNLNLYPSVYFNNIIIDSFENIPKRFSPRAQKSPPLFLMTASRSDSHESDEDFQKDIEANLKLLKPGGCLLTDGIRASYSRVYRFQEIQDFIQGNPEYKAEVFIKQSDMHDKNDEPKVQLFIQRAHPDGFLTDEEKRGFLADGVSVISLENALKHPHLRILNAGRRELMRRTANKIDYFKILQRTVSESAAEALSDKAAYFLDMEELGKKGPFLIQYQHKYNYPHEIFDDILMRIQTGQIELPEEAIEDIIDEVKKNVEGYLRQARIVDDPKTEFLNPEQGYLYTYPSIETGISDWHRHHVCYKISSDELPSNEVFTTPEMQGSFEAKRQRLLREIKRLKKAGIEYPIKFFGFEDCVTNRLLEEKLRAILGNDFYEDYVCEISIRFESQSALAANVFTVPRVTAIVPYMAQQGGIIVGGGSWHDSYVEEDYRKLVGDKLLNEVFKPSSRLRMMNICFSAQIMADSMGRKFYGEKLKTFAGMFEIGPTPVDILPRGKRHPWFAGFPERISVATTHSGHVYHDMLKRDYRALPTSQQLMILAESNLTGLPLAWETCHGRMLGTLIHPEIDLVNHGAVADDVHRVQEQVQTHSASIKRRFGITPDHILHNWRQVIDKKGKPRVNANVGNYILVNGLLNLAESIPDFVPNS